MNLSVDPAELRPIVESVVVQVVRSLDEVAAASDARLAFTEAEAAELMGMNRPQLREARLRGEITGTKLGGRIGYERSELIAYLARGRMD